MESFDDLTRGQQGVVLSEHLDHIGLDSLQYDCTAYDKPIKRKVIDDSSSEVSFKEKTEGKCG